MIIYGDQNVELPAHINFGKFLLDHLLKFQDSGRIAMINGETGEKTTYKEFANYSVHLARGLIDLGIGKGDVVAIGSEKRNNLGPTILAVLLTGATYTVYHINSGNSVLRHKLSVARPNYFIVSRRFSEKYIEVLSELKNIKSFLSLDDNAIISGHIIKSLIKTGTDVTFQPADVNGQTDVALILYSSGTIGLPKGVRLTHLNCILNSYPYHMDFDVIKTIMTYGEWYHNYDTFTMYKFLTVGCAIVYCDTDSGEKLLNYIEKYQVNVAMILPHIIVRICKAYEENPVYATDSLKIIYSRAAPLHIKTIKNIKERFPLVQEILQGYGMTECGELSSENRSPKGPKPGSVGVVSPGVILKISDISKTLGPNERGEIRAKGPVLMKEYIDMDPATYLDEEGFLKTGDLGYYDDDKYFYIVDRIKEIMTYRGDQVPPLELETILQLHPEVLEAGVVGKYDEVYGDIPTAFIVLKPGAKVTEQELIDYVADEVPTFMQLAGGVRFISKLPRNPRGKILRKELRDIVNEMRK